MREHIESAVAELDQAALIRSAADGISGGAGRGTTRILAHARGGRLPRPPD